MTLKKRERKLIGIFAAALAALSGDRLFLSSDFPRSALGEEAQGDDPLAADLPTLPQHASTSRPATPATVADVFEWSRLGDAGSAVRAEAAPPPAPDTAARDFEAGHRLEGVVLGSRPTALVDGVALHVGDELGGFRLRDVRLGAAEFVSDGAVAVLHLPEAGKPR